MSLAVALNSARSSLRATAAQVAVSSGNIGAADDPTRSRRIATQTTAADGSSRIGTITRATDLPLLYRLLSAQSTAAGTQAIADGLERLHETIGDPADGLSPAGRLGTFATALQSYANAPSDRSLAQAAVNAAQALATTINDAGRTVAAVRNDADGAMADAVDRLNGYLREFESVNQAAVYQTLAGEDATDALDRRDALLRQIGEEIGVTVVQRGNNDVALYTDGGVTLFDKTARTVSFTPSTALAPGSSGNPVSIDGVPVTGANAAMPSRSGRIVGLAELRDTVAPTYQAQIDELARGLVESFAEADQSGGGGPNLAGLFTWSGGPTVPAAGTLVSGIAASLRINPAVVPGQGGNLDRLRDGGINGAAYSYNIAGAAGFNERLAALTDGLGQARNFDAAAGLTTSTSLLDFSAGSAGWVEAERKAAADAADYQGALATQVATALSNAVGVNLDDEYALQLQLEQSYQASSKLFAIIDSMFRTLLEVMR